ncbi:MAG TPA: glycoside hydrolase family 9 protein [Gammaproteobacteria bacterium]
MALAGCPGGDDSGSSGQSVPPEPEPAGNIRLNQLGFYPDSKKIAVVTGGSANTFSVLSADALGERFSGTLSDSRQWAYSNENVRLADFSALTSPGRYRVRVEGFEDSPVFEITDGVYGDLAKASIKAFYYNRSGTALDAQHAGQWARAMGHPDTDVRVHASAASPPDRPEGKSISSPEGWYDAGDYNKYIVNSGISTYTLLAAYEHFSDYYNDLELNIPESGNNLPDILDEALWNIRWMLTMQDPGDGGVYHKLTTQNFAGFVMPDQATATRYVVQKSTSAALNFATVMAVANRVLAAFDGELPPDFAEDCLAAAVEAWNWAVDNPSVAYLQPPDIHTGAYAFGGDTFADEFAWAAAELYLATSDPNYYDAFIDYRSAANVPSWGFVDALPWVSLAFHIDRVPSAEQAGINASILAVANELLDSYTASAYGTAMGVTAGDFVWGSNSIALNQGLMLIQAYRINGSPSYLEAAQANLDYILGRNATGYSFVTGYGDVSPQNIHHRQSAADGIAVPVPGFVVGGPQSGQQDGCDGYPSNLPARSYIDNVCSYSTNEVTINWNAPLVYLSGALESLSRP